MGTLIFQEKSIKSTLVISIESNALHARFIRIYDAQKAAERSEHHQ
jgi:hypothetical protein